MKHHLYIHFPYCLYKCHYCDFNSHAYDANEIPTKDYVSSLMAELSDRLDRDHVDSQSEFTTIYFGGGTPSLMSPQFVEEILNTVSNKLKISSGCEITLEANPGTVTKCLFNNFVSAGLNRLSLGIQSLQDKYLKSFGRIHTADEALLALRAALSSNLPRVSADLIFGFPGQSLSEWKKDLKTIREYSLNHISCYALTAEPGTIYTRDVKKEKLVETTPEQFSDMLNFTYDELAANDLRAYEISNFSKAGQESLHNLGYWNYEPYLGIGAGAVSNLIQGEGMLRTTNHKLPEKYMTGIASGDYYSTENISKDTAMFEYIMMGLRLTQGIRIDDFEERFGIDFSAEFDQQIEIAIKDDLVLWDVPYLRPTKKGLFFNNQLVTLFLN